MQKTLSQLNPTHLLLVGYVLWLTIFVLGILRLFNVIWFYALTLLILPLLGLIVLVLSFKSRRWWQLVLSLPLIVSWVISMAIFFSRP